MKKTFSALGLLAAFFMLAYPAYAVSLVLDGTSATLDDTKYYDSITLKNGATLYITPYSGTGTTGTLTLNVAGDVNIDSASKIIGDGRGYRGGSAGAKGVCSTSGCTEVSRSCGWYSCSYWYDCPPVSGGGSGGEMGGSAGGAGKTGNVCVGCGNQECSSWGNAYYSYPGGGGGGGSGGYGTAGGGSGGAEMGTPSGYDISMGAGGGGGGGGGSTGNTNNADGGKGGNGGASLTINAKNIVLRGTVSLNGENGGSGGKAATPNTWYSSGCWAGWCWKSGPYYTFTNGGNGGGGGAGGGILLNASNNIDASSAKISAVGGSGGAGGTNGDGSAAAGGSSGGGGRIKIFSGGTYTSTGATISAGTVYSKNVFVSGAQDCSATTDYCYSRESGYSGGSWWGPTDTALVTAGICAYASPCMLANFGTVYCPATSQGPTADACSGTCGTGTNSCVWRDWHCAGSSASETYNDNDLDASQTNCNSCKGAGYWSLGGDPGMGAQCCGDDSSEHKRTRTCGVTACSSDTNDDACCSATEKCVFNSACYANGYVGNPSADGTNEKCESGAWLDANPPTVSISKTPSTVYDYNQITLSSTALDNDGIKSHKIKYWVNDTLNGKDCGASNSCVATIGPYAGGTAIKYQGEATDNVNNIGNTTVYSFAVLKTNNVHIGGKVWYNNNTANAQIQSVLMNVTIDSAYSNWGYPSSQGDFYITVEHVPATLTQFAVEIKAKGEVFSTFRCNYDYKKGLCNKI